MKRFNHLYEKVYDIDNLRKAHKNASKGKGWYYEVKEINKDPDRYLYQLPVYGNTGDAITFRLYDHDQELELTDYEITSVNYVDEGYGSLGNPYVLAFTGTTPQPQGLEITLTPGWNWISYLLLTEKPLEEVFVNLTPGDGDMIKGQGGFSTYNAATQQWSGSITNMQPGRGYMYMNTGTQTKTFSYPTEGK